MDHLKQYKIFESEEHDLLEIRELFQEVADEWDFAYKPFSEILTMVNAALDYTVSTGGGYYSIAPGTDDTRHIVIYLPHKSQKFISIDMNKFNSDVDKFNKHLESIGFTPRIVWPARHDSIFYIIAINI